MTSPAVYQAAVATILVLTATALYAYTILKDDPRAGPMRVGAALNLLAGLMWGLSAVVSLSPPSERTQSLLGAARALPFGLALGYVAWLLRRSIAAKYPTLERLLRPAPIILLAAPLLQLGLAVADPYPALRSYDAADPEVLVPRLRNLAEIFFISVAGVVFYREARNPNSPHPSLRLQNGLFCWAAVAFVLAVAVSVIVALLRVFAPPAVREPGLLAAHPAQAALLLAAGLLYCAGLLLYHPVSESDRRLALLRRWIQARHELELLLDFLFPDGSLGNGTVAGIYYRAAYGLALDNRDAERGILIIRLLAALYDPRNRTLLSELRALQAKLISAFAPTSSPHYTVRFYHPAHLSYDLNDDDLYQILEPTLALLDLRSSGLGPPVLPAYAQLAAFLAADARLLPEPAASALLQPQGNLIVPRIRRSYRAAAHAEKRARN